LQSISIPSTVTKIDEYVFNSCTELKEVLLNEGLQKIGESAFRQCTSLHSITIPSTVIEIGKEAFDRCTNLRTVIMKEGIKKIGEFAFRDCTSLERITLPSTVDGIQIWTFGRCTNLREVVIHNEEMQFDDKSFYNCTSLERFKFPGLSARLEDIIQAGQRDIEAKMDDIPAVEWRGSELFIPSVNQEIRMPWGRVDTLVELDKEKLNKIVRLIKYYEMKEATTLFELALWKARIDQEEGASTDRGACRIEVPGPVKDTILQYL